MIKSVSTLAVLAVCGFSLAQRIYSAGQDISEQAISLQAWGSGSIAQTDEVAFEGTTSLRIATRNYFQGGRMILGRPVDLSSAYTDKFNLLLFTWRPVDGVGTESAGPSFSDPGPGKGGSGMPGFSRDDDGGRRGGRGNTQPAGDTKPSTLKNIRVILTTTDGLRSEAYVPIPEGGAGPRGWRRLGVPLQAISGFGATNKIVSEVAISGDATTTFYIGEMQILNDATPIYGEPNVRELNLALGDEVILSANADGGASILRYTWDFDVTDGIQVDAEGRAVRRRFRKPGSYTITLTITDLYGLKPPFSTTLTATVNP